MERIVHTLSYMCMFFVSSSNKRDIQPPQPKRAKQSELRDKKKQATLPHAGATPMHPPAPARMVPELGGAGAARLTMVGEACCAPNHDSARRHMTAPDGSVAH